VPLWAFGRNRWKNPELSLTPAPLFRDPLFDGAADPTVIWNRAEKAWWIVYTNRRASLDLPGFEWVHGTDIGIAQSRDGGATWRYEGVWQGLETEPGRNTFWAPEVLWANDRYHAYVSYVPGTPTDWNAERHIRHYISDDLRHWTFRSRLPLSSDRCIDACVFALPDGGWRLWYKDEMAGAQTWCADSDDLFTWRVLGPVLTDTAHEGPNVFAWRGAYWMLTDPWRGLDIYRSDDLAHWTRSPHRLLDTPGTRPDDGAIGRHGDVLIADDRAFLFYFTHPGGDRHVPGPDGIIPYALRRTSLQVARLTTDGRTLSCDRDAPVDLPPSP
jgi:hypothetical protein